MFFFFFFPFDFLLYQEYELHLLLQQHCFKHTRSFIILSTYTNKKKIKKKTIYSYCNTRTSISATHKNYMPKMSKYHIYNFFPTVPILGFGILLSLLAGKLHYRDRQLKANGWKFAPFYFHTFFSLHFFFSFGINKQKKLWLILISFDFFCVITINRHEYGFYLNCSKSKKAAIQFWVRRKLHRKLEFI